MKQAERDKQTINRILEDINILQERIKHFDLNSESFAEDRSFEGEIAFDAIMNPLYRIVEDTVHLPEDVTSQFPNIPWHNIRGFRNLVAHGYWEVDRDAAWLIIQDDIPELAGALKKYLEE